MSKTTLYLIPSLLAENTENAVLSPQIFETVKQLDCFLVEEIRSARRFISGLKTGRVIEDLQFQIVDKKTKPEEMEAIFKKFQGKNIGVISEAGCPGVADPGALAVEYAHKKNMKVVPLVGPSSILLALMASGMNGQSFTFKGYLPINRQDRVEKIQQLEKESFKYNQTQIFIETPFRNNQVFEDLLIGCSNTTKLCVACEITNPTEFIKTKLISEWKTEKIDLHKKPTIFLIHKS